MKSQEGEDAKAASLRELREAVGRARAAALSAARKRSGSGAVYQETAVFLDARLTVIERALAELAATFAQALRGGDVDAKTEEELRDYWELVTREISGE